MTNMTDTTPTPTPETVKRYEPCFDMEYQGYFMLQDGERVEAYEKMFVDESDYALMESRALAAEAEVERLRGAVKWQPMETIPTGVDVLLVDKWGGRGIGEMDSDGTLRIYGIGEVAPWDERGWLPLPTPPMKEGE